jgi:hypothetical protein
MPPPAGTGDRRLRDWRLLYPLVFALWPPLSFYAHNIDHFRLDVLWLPLLVSLGVAAILQGLVLATVRQPSLAAFKTFGFLCLLFAGGRVCLALRGTPLPGTSMDVGVLVAGATLLLALLALAARPPRGFDRLPAALALFCVALVAQPTWTIVAVELARARLTLHRTAAIEPARAVATFPHIFYLVLDGYAREDVLRDLYGHDNRPFLDGLRSRGCYVASSAVANYPQTALSLASSLNLDYLDEWVAGLPPGSSDRHVLSEAIGRSRLVEALRASGYTFVAFSSGYGVAEARSADRFESLADSEAPLEFWRGFLASTPVPDLVSLPALVAAGEELHRRGVLYTFDRLGPLARFPGPLFVLAHVIAPHPPFVFDARGRLPPGPRASFTLSDGEAWRANNRKVGEDYRRAYVAQLQFVNSRTLEAVGAIQAEASRPVVILVQGDHGPGSELDRDSAERTNLRERLAILSAYCFPDGDFAGLYAGISPVNSFRVVLNRYLGRQVPLLPDRAYFATWSRPYDFQLLRALPDGGLAVASPP